LLCEEFLCTQIFSENSNPQKRSSVLFFKPNGGALGCALLQMDPPGSLAGNLGNGYQAIKLPVYSGHDARFIVRQPGLLPQLPGFFV
jgi:hypothetical protein